MNIIDLIFFVIIFFVALIALIKGFVREAFGKLSIIGAIFSMIALAPEVTKLFLRVISNRTVAVMLSYIAVFLISFLILRFIQLFLEGLFETRFLSGLNRFLGFVLGFLEGVVIVLFIMVVMTYQRVFDITGVARGSIFFRYFRPFLDYTMSAIQSVA